MLQFLEERVVGVCAGADSEGGCRGVPRRESWPQGGLSQGSAFSVLELLTVEWRGKPSDASTSFKNLFRLLQFLLQNAAAEWDREYNAALGYYCLFKLANCAGPRWCI